MRQLLKRAICISSLALLFLAQFAVGQAVYGNITGTVTDPSGAAVPNAAVVITDTNRGASYQTKSNDSGNYEQTHLLAGHYKVAVSGPGFASSESSAEVQHWRSRAAGTCEL